MGVNYTTFFISIRIVYEIYINVVTTKKYVYFCCSFLCLWCGGTSVVTMNVGTPLPSSTNNRSFVFYHFPFISIQLNNFHSPDIWWFRRQIISFLSYCPFYPHTHYHILSGSDLFEVLYQWVRKSNTPTIHFHTFIQHFCFNSFRNNRI